MKRKNVRRRAEWRGRETHACAQRKVGREPRSLETANQEKCAFLLPGIAADTPRVFSARGLDSGGVEGQAKKTSAIWYEVSLPIILRDSSSLSHPWADLACRAVPVDMLSRKSSA